MGASVCGRPRADDEDPPQHCEWGGQGRLLRVQNSCNPGPDFIWPHLEPWPLAAKLQKATSTGEAGVPRGQWKGEGTPGREKTRRLISDAPTADTSLQPVEETPRDSGVHSRPATDVNNAGHLPAARASRQMLCPVWSAPGGQETVGRESRGGAPSIPGLRETGLGALHQRTPP